VRVSPWVGNAQRVGVWRHTARLSVKAAAALPARARAGRAGPGAYAARSALRLRQHSNVPTRTCQSAHTCDRATNLIACAQFFTTFLL